MSNSDHHLRALRYMMVYIYALPHPIASSINSLVAAESAV